MENELIGITGAQLEKTGVISLPPILVQKPLIETYRPTPWASHSRPLRLLASRVREARGLLSAIRSGKETGQQLADFLDDFKEE
eukprot:3653846-Heterocapsa_arctica.AAC.1